MLDTVSTGVMSAMARMYLIVIGFLQHFVKGCHRQGFVALILINMATRMPFF
jgi:hypothetical protein